MTSDRDTKERAMSRLRAFVPVAILALCLLSAMAALALVQPTPPASAATFTVTKTADTNDGVCDADCSLREAVVAANALPGADTITVPAGAYNLTILGCCEDLSATGDLDLTGDVTVTGAGAGATVIDATALGGDRVLQVLSGVAAQVSGVTITGGTGSGDGGGIYNFGTLTLSSSTVSGNNAFNGGGILNEGALTVNNSTVSGNTLTGGRGGGIANDILGIVWINNSTISGNIAPSPGYGGGIMNFGTLTVNNGTISGNGGALWGAGGIANGGTTTVRNTILANGISGNCAGTPLTSAGYNLSSDASCALGGAGDLNSTDPMLGPLANNGGPTQTQALLPGSPAIDGSNCTDTAGSTVTADQRGVPRPQGVTCDKGAFEFAATGATFAVMKTADTNDGVCDADCSLREAVVAANALPGPDAITLPAGTYNLTIAGASEDASATGDLDLTAETTITGAGAGATVINASALGGDRVLHLPSGVNAQVSGVTISGGTEAFGGGILSFGTLTVNNSTISDNSGGTAGGGIHSSGILSINNSTISGNSGGSGGGIFNSSTLTINNSTITGNTATTTGAGGGIRNAGTVTVNNSTISGNSATWGGGGTYNNSSTTLTVNNSTISGNSGALWGGGIFNDLSTTVTVNNTTISGNSAGSGGGGIANAGATTVRNSILANGTGGNCAATPLTSAGYNLSSDASCAFGGAGDQNSTGAMLGPLASNGGPTQTQALLPGSPAIDAGSCTDTGGGPVIADQRGVLRPQGVTCDKGAFEVALPFTPTFSVVQDEDDGPADPLTPPTDDECRAGQPCEQRIQYGLPAGQPLSDNLFVLPGDGGPTGAYYLTPGIPVPNGVRTARATVNFTLSAGSGCTVPFAGTFNLSDGALPAFYGEGPDDASAPALANPAVWPTRLESSPLFQMLNSGAAGGYAGAVVWSRATGVITGLGIPVNYVTFNFGSGWATVEIIGDPTAPLPPGSACTPASMDVTYLGETGSDDSSPGRDLRVCTAGTHLISGNFWRQDTSEAVMLLDSNLCDLDTDGDGVTDTLDNCPDTPNPAQQNAVHPASPAGDHCDDPEPDGVMDLTDNCPSVSNPGQENHDTDVYGDACDADDDDDGYVDADETLKASDSLVKLKTPEHCDGIDEDGDTVVDDEPPGGGYSWDTDGDTVKDCADASIDTDGDTIGNPTDTDDDGDGYSDTVEVFVSTDPLDRCPDNSSDDAHPLDQDRNGSFNVSDILKYKGKTPASGMTTPKSAMYNRRLDIDGNGSQNVSDILKYKGKTPSACT